MKTFTGLAAFVFGRANIIVEDKREIYLIKLGLIMLAEY
jgi:hypothetical protein